MPEIRIEPHPEVELPKGEFPVYKRKPTKNPKILKLREISARGLIRGGLKNIAREAGLIK